MTNDQTASLIYSLLLIMLIGAGFLARRVPMATTAKMAAAWIAIFAVIFAGVAFWDDVGRAGRRLLVAADPQGGTTEGGTIRIPMGEDGHFRVRATVNGISAPFLIDSGATTTALSARTARRAGIAIDDSGFGVAIDTANGTVVARRVRIDRFEVGPIRREQLAAITAAEFGDTNVIGMNFLSTLSKWGVEGRDLVLVE